MLDAGPIQPTTTSRLAVLMFTDVVGSSELKTRLGTPAYAALLRRHDELFRSLLASYPSAELLQDTGDGYFAAFRTVSDAVRFALRFQDAMHREPWSPEPLRTRVGIHLGELAQLASDNDAPAKVVGFAADVAARLMSLARGGQILLTRAAFDEARQFVSEYPAVNGETSRRALRWMAHGDYIFQGATEPIEVFEVGGDGIAPLAPPRDREKAHRSHLSDHDEILGWRPAVGLSVPQAPAWQLERKLGEGTFGEVWLARHGKLKQSRVFKFCFDAERLESFKRELTLFRLLRDALGERPDIAKLYDVCLDHPPYFLESEYAPAGNLIDWSSAQGGLGRVPLERRIEIVAQVCDAVAAAHSVGVLHKDIKPSNILMHAGADGTPRPQLTDFGIGMLTDRGQLAARHITEMGFTMPGAFDATHSGTRIYAPPESLTGRPFTTQGDIYALGILLYQMTIADLDRPLSLGWERGVDDELLREDIAACVDGDPERRINSAAEVATRLRHLSARRAERADEARLREASLRRHRLLRIAAVITVACCVLGVLALVGFFRERRLRVDAQVAYAAGAVDQGTALHLAGRAQQSRAAFLRARDAYTSLSRSALAADVGLYRSFREFDAPILTIPAGDEGIMSVAWLPDGKRIASAGEDGLVHVWDAQTGRGLRTFRGHEGLVASVAVSPDGKFLLSGGADKTIRLWEVEGADDEAVHIFKDPIQLRGVAFSPNGNLAASGSYGKDATLRIWDLTKGEEAKAFPSPSNSSFAGVAFSPDGRRVLGASYGNGDVWVWDLDGDRPPLQLPGNRQYTMSAAFSRDGKQIVAGGYDRMLRLWDAETGKPLRPPMSGHADGLRGVTFIGDQGEPFGIASRALTCSMDGTVKLWDLATGNVVRTFAGHTNGVRGLAVSPDGTRAVSGSIDRTLLVWDLRPNNEVPSIVDDPARKPAVTSLASTPDGLGLVSANEIGGVTLRDVATLRTVQTYVGHDRPIECAVPLSDGKRLFTADDMGAAKLWDLASGQVLGSFPPRLSQRIDSRLRSDDWCYTAVSADGAVVVSSVRKVAEVWSPASDKVLGELGPHDIEITCVAVAPDGTHALTGDLDGTLYYWDLTTRALVFRTPRPGKRATLDCVALSADGKTALAGGHDMVLRLWDLVARREIRAFHGHTLMVRAAGFAHGGRTVFSGSGDQTLKLFETDTGNELELAAQFPAVVFAATAIPKSDAIAAASGPRISVWDVSRAARHVEAQSRVAAACAKLRADANDAAALRTVGEWYALRGIDDAAVDLLERARAAGDANVFAITLARCHWRLGHQEDAAREFRRAIDRKDAPPAYVNLCIAAVECHSTPTTQPSANTAAP